ncbi:proline-rich receptor-like protein kinase PERK9 [Triticum dicoccoides]|uniref:proline-rich receptor-like protein kinase PERK9 n=1 Tax=Triticum dicoccoides TaxID=85692 RepID=UPI001890C4E5|nr:proline-rich receptor-like protein kinase PERK9 [Triticum dicoccoides]
MLPSPWPRPPCSPRREKTPRRTATVHFVHPEDRIDRGRPVHSPSPPSSSCTSPRPRRRSASPRPSRPRTRSPPTSSRPRDDADAPVIDYVTDDPSFSPEQPDDGVQEPDDTFDDCYYTKGVCYHVTETADDQE